jgi:hypothetical protein
VDSVDEPTGEQSDATEAAEGSTVRSSPTEPAPGQAAKPEELAEPQAAVDSLIRRYLSLPPISIVAVPPQEDGIDRKASTLPPSAGPSVEDMRSFDAVLTELEPLLAETNWDAVLNKLQQYESLPPQLALLYAIAQREREATGDADAVAIRAVAALLCLPEDSHTALVIAKRLIRRNPVAWQKRKAPSVRSSIMIALLVAVVGALAGYLLSPGVPIFD